MSSRVAQFDGHSFEFDTGRLWAGTTEVRLTPKASATLRHLIEQAGTLVTKDDLFHAVWPDVVVGDDALISCVQELRKALGDDARQPRFIETRHRRGYRFVADVTDQRTAAVTDSAAPATGAAAQDVSVIGVLPFIDMSPNRDQDFLCDGLAEELIDALTQVEGLRVAARAVSFQFRDPALDVQAAGRQLGVGTLLTGSVRRVADRLRVIVQVVEVATGYLRWSHRFDRTVDDVFAVQDEIAQHVVGSVRGTLLTPSEQRAVSRLQTAVPAFEYYLRGRQTLPRMTWADLRASAEMFRRATDVDPTYGPAWAGTAMVHATLYEWFGRDGSDLASAEQASQQALRLTPGVADAHVARGFVLSLTGRYQDAAVEFSEAIALNKNLFDGYYYYARAAFASGDTERAATLFQQAGDVRPDDFQSPTLQAQCLEMLGRPAAAAVVYTEAARRAEHVLTLNPSDARALSLGAAAVYHAGHTVRAFTLTQRGLELYPDDPGVLINAACLYAKSGQKEDAIRVLERAFARGWGKRDWVEHDPDYDSLRDDPRFQRLLATLG